MPEPAPCAPASAPESRGTGDNERRLFRVMILTATFTVVEAAGGLLTGSLALFADSAHMLSDTVALALAWFAFRISRRPTDALRSYGYDRVQVLAAFANGLALIALALWIAVEAVQRLLKPAAILAEPMALIALAGLGVNFVAFAVLHRGDRRNLNLRGALLHVLGDLMGSVAALTAAVVIMASGWTPIDPLLSLVVAGLIVRSAVDQVRRSGHILLEGIPEGVELDEVRRTLMAALPDVTDIHHVHIWSLTSERPVLTLHAVVPESADSDRILKTIHRLLEERFGIGHATIQIERARCLEVPEGTH